MTSPTPAQEINPQLDSARKELTKLPMLGPVLWLYARDPNRRFTFVGDLDWRLLPPLVLDQCSLFSKEEVPWAYFAWAKVSPEVDQRLRTSTPVIGPHEWHSGDIPWLIDVVMPYGEDLDLLKQAIGRFAPGQLVNALMFNTSGQLTMRQVQG